MISRAAITDWSKYAPWPNNLDVEQDLLLSRCTVAIFSDEFLGDTTLLLRPGIVFSPEEAYALVRETLIERLPGRR